MVICRNLVPFQEYSCVRGRSRRGRLPLAALIETKRATARPGSTVRIQEEFTTGSPYALILDLREGGFDPAAADPTLPTQRHQRDLRAAALGEHRIAGTREFLVGDRIRFETRPRKDRRVFCWKILVDFELQALISSGKSTVPSRVNSAAYANAASISGSVSAA